MAVMQRVMSFLRGDNAKGFIDVRSSAGSAIIAHTAGRPQWPRSTYTTYDEQGYRRVALIFRCIQYVASAAGSAPLRVYETIDAGQTEEQDEHALRTLLKNPNPEMGESRFLSYIVMLMNTTGVAIIEKERDRAGNVIGLWPLRTDWCRPIPRQHASPDWEYRVPGIATPFRLDADDVIVIPYADTPTRDYMGIGPLEVALREVAISNAMTDFLKAFFDRGAMPMYVAIPSDDPRLHKQWEDEETIRLAREKFRQTVGGLHNALDVLFLVGLKDVKPMGFNFDEMAYPQLRNLSELAICQAFGIPAILVGAQAGLDRSTYNNTQEARREFYEGQMTTLWSRIDDAFTRHLLPEFETDPRWLIQFDVSDVPALKDDEKEKWDHAIRAFQASLISRHVAQREVGIDTHGDDVFLQPALVIEVPVDRDDTQRSRRPAASARLDDPKQLPQGKRDLPPDTISGTDDQVSHDEVEDAIDQFDEDFPEAAGLLRAKVVNSEAG